MSENEVIVHDEASHTLALPDVQRQVQLIQQVLSDVMQDGQHYGVIPGCGSKPSLLKPGAEKIAMTFRLAPAYDVRREDLGGGHREYEVTTTLTHIPTGHTVGQGLGCASTMESKHRWRKGERECPQCGGSGSIIKGRAEYGGGWLCFAKKGGCGAKFADGDPDIEGQDTNRVENADPADQWNTVLKMAKKRSLVDAILTATAASDIFTQDLEDIADNRGATHTGPPPAQPKPEITKPAETMRRTKYDNVDQGRKSAGDMRKITEPQRKRLWAICKTNNVEEESLRGILTAMGYESSGDITRQDYEVICEWAENGGQHGPAAEEVEAMPF